MSTKAELKAFKRLCAADLPRRPNRALDYTRILNTWTGEDRKTGYRAYIAKAEPDDVVLSDWAETPEKAVDDLLEKIKEKEVLDATNPT